MANSERPVEVVNETQFASLLQSVLESLSYDKDVVEDLGAEDLLNASLRSFDEAGLLTSNEGIVVRLRDGSEYQLTVVQRR